MQIIRFSTIFFSFLIRNCFSLETSLGEKHSGMNVSSEKGFQQSLSTYKEWILVDESEKKPQLFIDK